MSKNLIVNGTTYEFPISGTEPDWGEEVSDWAEAVTDTISDISPEGDIVRTAINLLDNQSTPLDILGFQFDGDEIQGIIIEYSITRSNGTNEMVEVGNIYGTYNTTTTQWYLAQVGAAIGSTGITFSIQSNGQMQYTSTALGGSHSCRLVYRARSFSRN